MKLGRFETNEIYNEDSYLAIKECQVECDYCGKDTVIDSTDYSEINQQLKHDGWLSRKIDNEWYEFCSTRCYEKFIKENK